MDDTMTSLTDQLHNAVTEENTCLIWWTECQGRSQDATATTVVDSPRAGGSYVIDRNVSPELRKMYVSLDASGPDDGYVHRFRARLTTMLVRERQLGNDLPKITMGTIVAAQSAGPARMEERLTNLLRFLIDSTPRAGYPIDIAYPEPTPGMANDEAQEKAKRNGAYALAHSESTNAEEMEYLIDSLATRGLVNRSGRVRVGNFDYVPSGLGFLCVVTTDGHIAVESLQTEGRPDQCFVALWFNEKTNALYDKAIAPAVAAIGYKPIRIDRQPNFLGKIDDQIIAEIRRSRFVIADFTHDERGARGSVYYEAGFAHGLGIPVIFTCQDDQIDDLHFDTNHFLHLPWPTNAPEELIEPLKSRIAANIGVGPHAAGGI